MEVQRFLIYSPLTCTARPHYQHPPLEGTFVTTPEPALIGIITHVHILHFNSFLVLHIVWFFTTVQWHVSIIMVPYGVFSLSKKSSVFCLFILPPSTLTKTDLFYCLYGFAFPRMSYSWDHTAYKFQISFFHLVRHI